MIIEILLLTVSLLIFIYYQLTKYYGYWKNRGVKYLKPHFIFGNFYDIILGRIDRPRLHQQIYNAASGEQLIGIIQMRTPAVYIVAPDLIRHVLAKDFSSFHDRGIPFDEKVEKLSAHLFNLEGARWRNLRQKLTPTFTSGKIKNMFPLIEECAQEMVTLLAPDAEREEVVELREILARFTTDVIGTCAFGVQCNSLRNPDAQFRKMGAVIFKPSATGSFLQLLISAFPQLMKILPRPAALKEATTFFFDAILETVKFREKNDVKRADFLDLLIQIKKKGTIVSNPEDLKNDAFVKDMGNKKMEDFEFTDSLMASQAFVFFLAGFETSSTTLSYAFIELARNPAIQENLRDEIDEAFERSGNKFTYEAIMEMPYLDKVISETLRMYPPAPIILRSATENYTVPETNIVLEKGLRVFIPVYAIHRDPKHYPDPDIFDPERFSEEEKQKRHHYAYLPFGEGPRNCIGSRFGLLQTKLGLAMLLHMYQFEYGPQMPYPPVLSKSAFLLTSEHGTWLRIKKRTPREVLTTL